MIHATAFDPFRRRTSGPAGGCPDDPNDLIRHYTFSGPDLSVIRQHRGAANRLRFAVHLCYMRYPGVILGAGEQPFAPLLSLVATQLGVPPEMLGRLRPARSNTPRAPGRT